MTLEGIRLLQKDILHIIMFYGENCGPCKATTPHYETLAGKHTSDIVKFYRFHQWENDEYKKHGETFWGVTGVPSFKVVYNGETVLSKVGGGDEAEMDRFFLNAIEARDKRILSNTMKVKKMRPEGRLPEKAHVGDLGYDLFAAEPQVIYPGETTLISTGIAIQFPPNYGGLIRDRSSVATKQKLFNVAGVIDNGYIGEIRVALYNSTENLYHVAVGDKIAQMILIPVTNFDIVETDELMSADQRGDKGFGSSGV